MTMALFALAALAVTACATSDCVDGETMCSGDQLVTCVDGSWGEATDCNTGQSCQDMAGIEHCMQSM
jgi:hypothetical protein